MMIDLLKQNTLSGNFSNLFYFNGIAQLQATGTLITVNSATLFDQIFQNQNFDGPDCGIDHVGLPEHWVMCYFREFAILLYET